MTMPTNTSEQALEPIDWAALDQDEFAEKITALAESKGPALTLDDMDTIEQVWNTQMPMRRCTLAMMTKPYSWLAQKVETDRDFALTVAGIYGALCNGVGFYKTVANLMEQAEAKMMIALCTREDMDALIAEAEAANKEG